MYQLRDESYVVLIKQRFIELAPSIDPAIARELAEHIYEINSREMHNILKCLWHDTEDAVFPDPSMG